MSSLTIYRNKSNTAILSLLTESVNKPHHRSREVKIRSLIKELKSRELTPIQYVKYHKLVRKFSEY